MSRSHTAVDARFAEYIHEVSVREPDVLRRLRDETSPLPMARMQISPEQGQLMTLLVQLAGARRAIEVGVFTGYSSICVALGLPEDGKLIACDVNEEYTSMARRYWREAGVDHKIELRLAPALETLDGLIRSGQAGTFDFMFIDGDKENYVNYYERGLTLIRPRGLIGIDNVLWHGRLFDDSVDDQETRAIQALNRTLHHDERVWLSMLPIGDGLTLACKR